MLAASQRITPRALARRAKAARERAELETAAAKRVGSLQHEAERNRSEPLGAVDLLDCDPDPEYVRGVKALGASVRTSSSWLNALSVEATPKVNDRIARLPFVAEIRAVERAVAGAADFDAGPSYVQLDMMHLPEAHAMGLCGSGVLICVLDSGFQLEHEALRHAEVRAQRDFLFHDEDPSYDPRTDLPSQADHGTAVFGMLAAYAPGRLIGAAYCADFLLGKTERIGSEEPVEEDYWCAGLEWAEAQGADILTSSLSYRNWYRRSALDGRSAVTTRAANLAFERGLLIINAAGNDGPADETLGAPADAPGVISVGSVNGIGNLAGFSSKGPTYDRRVKPDVVAPGSGVVTVKPRTYDRYQRGSGTSYSAPLVAGCAALVMERHPDWGPEAVREAVVMSASRAEQPDNRYGWGIPNARDAVLYPLIEGRVTDFHTSEAIRGAVVRWRPVTGAERAGGRGPGGPGTRADTTTATARADTTDSPPRGVTQTDSTGAYVIPNLPRGSYMIEVSKDGYFDGSMGPYDVPPNLGDVNFALKYRGE